MKRGGSAWLVEGDRLRDWSKGAVVGLAAFMM